MRPERGRGIGTLAAVAGLAALLTGAAAADDFAPPRPSPKLIARFMASVGRSAPSPLQSVSVPTVGCPADGQTGPRPPPKLPRTVTVEATPGEAHRLAYYKAEPTAGVLAPRGWTCFGRYGSDGDILTVAPPESRRMLDSAEGKTAGPMVMITESSGMTSGRFAVAAVAARVFPIARKFARAVREEGLAEPGEIVFAPWPRDTVTRLSDRVIGYTTPAHARGLGVNAKVVAGDAPIMGVAFLSGGLEQPDLTMVRVRLERDADLYPAIAVNALPKE